MIKLITLVTTLLITTLVSATPSDDFVITVKTDNLGMSGNSAFIIPTRPALTYKYDVDCNDDGTYEVLDANGDYTCDYSGLGGPGSYTLRIKSDVTDSFPAIHFNDLGDKDKILTVQQWGKNPWLVMDSAFQGASNLTITATDAPDLSAVSSTFEMFKDAVSVDTDLAGWDVTNINVMNAMFSGVTLSRANYDAILISFNNQNVIDGVPFDAGNSKYCALLAHQNLIDNAAHNWDILDGGYDFGCPGTLDDFVIEVNTSIAGSTSNTQFEINTAGGGYNYNVDCDDANAGTNTAAGQTGNYICSYSTPGTYTIRISDNVGNKSGFPRIFSLNHLDHKKIINLKQWGTGIWTSMFYAFSGATNMVTTATDIPDLSNVLDMVAMFGGSSSANPDVSGWNTANVNYMTSLFQGATSANPDVSGWNTANVSSMHRMFSGATSATPDISNWNISSITTTPNSMQNMLLGITLPTALYDATLVNFDGQISASGIIFNGGNSKYCNVAAHDSLINTHGWIITDGGLDPNCPSPSDDFVITVITDNPGSSTAEMFRIPTKPSLTYNYNVDCNDDGINEATAQTGDYFCDYSVGGLNLGAGTYTIRIKDNTGTGDGFPSINFNNTFDHLKIIRVEKWGTGKWTNMQRAFYGAENLTFSTIEGNPDFSSVTTMEGMFWKATLANPKTTNWDTSSVTDMRSLFNQAENAQPDTSLWDTHMVEDMSFMFRQAFLANPDTSLWDTSKVLSMSSMFNQASIATPDTSSWDTAMVNNMSFMFRLALVAEPDVSSWNVEQVGDFNNMFIGTTLSTTTYDNLLITFDAQNVQANKLFHGGNSKYCAIAAHDNLDMGDNWTISDLGVDNNCPDPLGDFVITVKTDNTGTSADNEFTIPTNPSSSYNYSVDCNNDGINEIIGSTSDYTCVYPSASTYTVRIKYNQMTNSGFPRIQFNDSGDKDKLLTIEQWGTNPWTSMSRAFHGASNLTTTATDTPDFSNMTSMFAMFRDASSVNPNTSNWDTSSVTNMNRMFSGALNANPDVSNWNIENVTIMTNMFVSVTLPTIDYDAMLIVFSQQNVKQNILFSGGNSKYCAQSAHDILDVTNSWTISDGGLGNNCPDPLDYFIIEVDTTISGSTSNTQFEINTDGGGYNYNVDCDDANLGTNTTTGQTGNYICNYAAAGTYTILISDNAGDKSGFPRISGFGHQDMKKITKLKQWGTGLWSSMQTAFVLSPNMIVTATDVPNLSSVTSLFSMFAGASLANPDVSNWNTINITIMTAMFQGATSANPDVSNWNTANVTRMDFMFSGANSANPDVSAWNTSMVENMDSMFSGANLAIPNISNWDVSGITVPDSMESMLNGITLPRALYDTTLANFEAQVTATGIVFDAGNSKYCNVAAHDSLITTHGWTITDGGLDTNCPPLVEDIFSNGFEDVIIFKSTEAQFVYDFSQVSVKDLDENPLLIAKGLNNHHQPTLLIYLRNDLGQLQIRQDFIGEENQWIQGMWESIENKTNTLIHWNKTRFSQQIK